MPMNVKPAKPECMHLTLTSLTCTHLTLIWWPGHLATSISRFAWAAVSYASGVELVSAAGGSAAAFSTCDATVGCVSQHTAWHTA